MLKHNKRASNVRNPNQAASGITTEILDKTAPQAAIYFADSQSAFGGFHKLTPARLGRSEWLPCSRRRLWSSSQTSLRAAHQYS